MSELKRYAIDAIDGLRVREWKDEYSSYRKAYYLADDVDKRIEELKQENRTLYELSEVDEVIRLQKRIEELTELLKECLVFTQGNQNTWLLHEAIELEKKIRKAVGEL